MEGRVFICSWKLVGDRYRVWWKARPKVAAEGDTFEEADEALWNAIMEATGDGENMHEYDPPRPSDASGSARSIDLVMVGGQESGNLTRLDGLFVGGVCEECENALGARTDAPVVIEQMNSGPRNFGSIRRTFEGARMRYVSSDFRAMLTAEEDASVEWREIVGPPRARKKLFEIMGGRVAIPYVAPRDVILSGWRCETCGQNHAVRWSREPQRAQLVRRRVGPSLAASEPAALRPGARLGHRLYTRPLARAHERLGREGPQVIRYRCADRSDDRSLAEAADPSRVEEKGKAVDGTGPHKGETA